jgi:anti-anti-sigma factor
VILVLHGRRPAATPLTVAVDTGAPDAPVVLVGGDLDYGNAARLRSTVERLLDEAPRTIVLDFAGLTFMDSTGLSIIVQAWQEGTEHGTLIQLRSTPRFLESILDITGVGSLLSRQSRAAGSGDPGGRSAASA